MEKKKIVIIGAGEFQDPLIQKAKKEGYETHVFAWKCGDVGEKSADFFYPVSITQKERILTYCKEIKPELVVSVGSDLAVLTVNYLSRKLGLNCNCPESDLITTNKYQMRLALKKHGIWTPGFWLVETGQMVRVQDHMKFPLIVKPTDRSGSRGIFKIDRMQQLEAAVTMAQQQSFEKKALIEEFIEGEEFSCESISFHGKHWMLAVTKKFTTGAPHYIETGHLEPAGLPEHLMGQIQTYVYSVLDALKITDSASHCEFKIKDGNIQIIEVGARMGGDCIGTHLVYASAGYDYLEMVLSVAKGEHPKVRKKCNGNPALIRFLLDVCDWEMMKVAELDPKVRIIEKALKKGCEGAVTDSSSRKGYFVIQSEKEEYLRPYYPFHHSRNGAEGSKEAEK